MKGGFKGNRFKFEITGISKYSKRVTESKSFVINLNRRAPPTKRLQVVLIGSFLSDVIVDILVDKYFNLF